MNKWMLSLLLVTVIGLFLRTYNINAKEFWYDEAFTARMIQNSFSQIIYLSTKDVHPALYYLTAKAWTSIFGMSDFGIRSLSVLFGVLIIPATYYLVSFTTNHKFTGLFVSIVVAVNPFLITYSKEARAYSMFAFIFALLIIVLIRIGKSGKGWVWMSILLPVFFLTHYISVFSIPLVIWFLPKNKKLLISILPLLIIVLFQLPAMMAPRKAAEWSPPVTTQRINESIDSYAFGVFNDNSAILQPNLQLPVLFLVLLLLTILYSLDHNRNYYKLLIFGVVPIALVSLADVFGKNLYIERYLIPYGYSLIVYVGIVVIHLFKKYALFTLIIYSIVSIWITLSYTPQNVGYKDIANYIDSLGTVIFMDATEYIAVSRYSNTAKLQEGDWSDWVIIKESDISKLSSSKPFYLASRKPIKGWKYDIRNEGIYFYKWE